MAVGKGRSDAGKSVILLRRHVAVILGPYVRSRSSVRDLVAYMYQYLISPS